MAMSGDTHCDFTHVGVFGDLHGIIRDRERAQWVNYLPYKHEDLSSTLQHPCQKILCWLHVSETGGSQEFTGQLV